MKRRISQDMWVLLGLFVLLLIVGALIGKRPTGAGGFEAVPRRTSYSTRPGGLSGLYETLRKLDYPVKRRLDPLTELQDDGVLFIVSPENGVSPEERQALRQWVQRGNLLVLVAGNETSGPEFDDKPATSARPSVPSFLCPNVRSVAVVGRSRIDYRKWGFADADELGARFGPGLLSKSKSRWRRDEMRAVQAVFADDRGTAFVYSSWGKGGVLISCSPWSLSNAGIEDADNLVLVLNAIKHRGAGRELCVLFDEYHHGYGQHRGLMSLIHLPARLGLAEIGLAFLLLLSYSSRRFGRALHLREGTRYRGEYLQSLSLLLRKAGATGVVRSELGRKFLDDMAITLGLSPGISPYELLAAASKRFPQRASVLRELIYAADASPDTMGDEATVLSLVRRWHSIRMEMTKRSR